MLIGYLLLTIALELPIFLIVWRKQGLGRATIICVLLNGLTNPLINLAIQHLHWNVFALEAAVWLVEGLAVQVFFKPGWLRALAFSLLANGWSYGIGLCLQYFNLI